MDKFIIFLFISEIFLNSGISFTKGLLTSTAYLFNRNDSSFHKNPKNTSLLTGRDEAGQPQIHLQSEQTYYEGETIATLLVDEHANVTKCNILKAHTWLQKREAFVNLKANFVTETSFENMLGFIRTCHSLDTSFNEDEDSGGEGTDAKVRQQTSYLPQAITSTVQTASSVLRAVTGILPGTKWCGLNNVANNWSDLGEDRELDKCCRGHDVCPKTVAAFGRSYNLLNLNVYTSSHCECEAMFYDCLKELESVQKQPTPTPTVAGLLGNFYFNILRVQCINEEYPPKCANHAKLRRKGRGYGEDGISCAEWEDEPLRRGQKLVFKEFGHKW